MSGRRNRIPGWSGIRQNIVGSDHTAKPGLEWSIIDNRREARTLWQGEVSLFLENEHTGTLGTLMDISNRGFRAAHHEPRLSPGVHVHFIHHFFRGEATVMWSKAGEDILESGFQVVRE